jgi:hypothetical protein
LPFIKIESFQNAVPQEYIVLLPEIVLTPYKTVETIAPSWNWYLIIGIVVSSLLFIYKVTQLVQLKLKGISIHKGSYKIIKIPNSTLAFSIFNYVFLGEGIEERKLEDILSHELVHIREKHSIDLLYFELLRILFWFNPLVYIYQKRISEIHEYIADATIAKENNKSDYYEKLLAEVFQTQHFSFTNQFFKHSLIKKRIIMLTKQKSRQILKLKYLVLVPVIIVSLLYTSCGGADLLESDEKVETVSLEVKKEQLKDLMRELNELNASHSGQELLSRKQYEKRKELLEKMLQLMEEDGKVIKVESSQARSYEEYVAARKKSIAEDVNYSELETQSVEFSKIDKAPIFPGCEDRGTLEDLKKCFSESVQKHVNKNFDFKVADNLQLKGIQKIFTKFIIDKNGEVKDMKVRAPHPDLVEEVERILTLLPKTEPGMKDGQAVSIKYVLPITFKIQ